MGDARHIARARAIVCEVCGDTFMVCYKHTGICSDECRKRKQVFKTMTLDELRERREHRRTYLQALDREIARRTA